MNHNDDVRKVLEPWLSKAQKIIEPPAQSETRGTIQRPEPAQRYDGGSDVTTQLNFKISLTTKKRIKQLALRDNITLLAMLDRMIVLYEREYGHLEAKR